MEKKFKEQIGIAVSVVLLLIFIARLSIVKTLLSLTPWIFAFSLTYPYNPKNEHINTFIVSATPFLITIVIFEFLVIPFFDYMHLIPIGIGIVILIRERRTIDPVKILVFTQVLSCWFVLDRIFQVNYHLISVEQLIVSFSVWLVSNGIISIILWRKRNEN